ncbi:MAG: tetratricopeptide repeat protein [Alsobacter sp.]
MLIDRYQRRHTTASHAAVQAFESAVQAVAAHRPSAADALGRALEHDPHLVSGWALKGFAALILGRAELLAPARDAHARASDALGRHGAATESETVLVRALAMALGNRFKVAADLLEDHLDRHPADLLAVKLSQSLRFMGGDGTGMLAATTRLVPRWSPDMAGAGFVLGCHAFALEEVGRYREAEIYGHRALKLEPHDAWGLHAVSHVHEMENRTLDGIECLERTRSVWSGCNNFRFHMAWHLALFHLEEGRADKALALYDSEVRPEPTDDYRDVANAASLLWRLRQEGLEGGYRWNELAEIGRRRARETTVIFATLHNLLSLVGAGDRQGAHAVVEALRARADAGTGDQAEVAASVGLDLARIIVGVGGVRRTDLSRLARELPRLGGSNAQRDVFMRTLMAMAPETAAPVLLEMRRRLKREDRFAERLRRRMDRPSRLQERRHRHLSFAAM